MTDKTKTMLGYTAAVAGAIIFMNLGGGATFYSRSASADEPAASAPVAQPSAPRHAPPAAHPDREVTTRAGEPTIVTYQSTEQKIQKSIADARGKLPYFWEHAAHPAPGEKTFTLKVGFPVTKGGAKGREHMWVADVARNGATLTGRLDNDPDLMTSVRAGDTVTFSEDMITDWGFARNGKMIGFYSTRVMLEDAPAEEAAYIRAMLGENPA